MIDRTHILINGDWVDPDGTESITVVNPATEQAFASVPRCSAKDADRAVQAAADAFDSWSRTGVEERAVLLDRLTRILDARRDEITRTIVSEVGEPVGFAATNQTAAPIATLDITVESLRSMTFDEHLGATLVHRAPAGVVAAITPWNVPLLMLCMKVGAALAAGCTVVLKSTEVAPLSSFIFAEAAVEAGLPSGVFNLVTGTGPEVGEALVTHPLVDVVSLTGSLRAGRRVMELAAGSIKRVALELGGKSANLVLDDADLEAAVSAGVADAFRNSGQVCAGLTRVLVPRRHLAAAEEIAAAKAREYVLGDPFDPQTTLGPVATAGQRERVRGLVDAGIQQGARVVVGGMEAPPSLPRGYFVQPTVLSADNTNVAAREEIFGPVVTVIPYDGVDEGVRLANDSPYGLGAGIWGGDLDHMKALATRIRAGRVRINGSAVNPRAPHGGFKLSGIGRENGPYGIEEFLEYQAIG